MTTFPGSFSEEEATENAVSGAMAGLAVLQQSAKPDAKKRKAEELGVEGWWMGGLGMFGDRRKWLG